MQRSIRLLVAAAAIACASCAVQAPQSYPASTEARLALYAKATPCCDDPSGFPFKGLPPRGFADAIVDLASPVFDFHSGMSPFVAFELPAQTAPYRVRVKSLFDAVSGDNGSVFYPVVALLDETFIVTQMTGLDNLRLEPALATVGGEAGLAVSLVINPVELGGKYLVVFTPAALLGARPENRREGDMLTPASLAWLERRGETAIPASPYGRLRITIASELAVAEAAAKP
ncbi:MAG: MalM family protein [Steroidobacteraceae bacterium]